MMESRIPLIDRCVVAAKRDLEIVIVFEPDDTAFYLGIEACHRRCEKSCVGPRCKTQLTHEAHFLRQIRIQMQHELAFRETTPRALLVGAGEVEIAKAGNLQGRALRGSLDQLRVRGLSRRLYWFGPLNRRFRLYPGTFQLSHTSFEPLDPGEQRFDSFALRVALLLSRKFVGRDK